jgi:hypothetical protein
LENEIWHTIGMKFIPKELLNDRVEVPRTNRAPPPERQAKRHAFVWHSPEEATAGVTCLPTPIFAHPD